MIYRDAKAFDKALSAFSKSYKTIKAAAHSLACSVLFHTGEHRQVDSKDRTDKLHRFYDGLKRADQDAFRQWLAPLVSRKVADKDGKISTQRWLTGRKNDAGIFEFRVIPVKEFADSEKMSKECAGNIEEIETRPAFFDSEPSEGSRNPFVYDDAWLLKGLKAFLKKAEEGKKANTLPESLFSTLDDAVTMIDNAVTKLHDSTPLGKASPKSEPEVTAEIIKRGGKAPQKVQTFGGKKVPAKKEPEEIAA